MLFIKFKQCLIFFNICFLKVSFTTIDIHVKFQLEIVLYYLYISPKILIFVVGGDRKSLNKQS